MARPKKTEEPNVEVVAETTLETTESPVAPQPVEEVKVDAVAEATSEIPRNVIGLMKLYPQYEEMWVTANGFVHPKNAPSYCTKGAKLYKNKFYNKK